MSGEADLAQGLPKPGAAAWRRFSVTLVGVTLALFAGVAAGMVVIDPFDTGRLTPLGHRGMAEGPPWAVNASRARDLQFNAAVIGNSRTQMLEPDLLNARTGDKFVNLSIPGSTPPEVKLVAGAFLRDRPAPRAMVIGIDEWWCRPTQTQAPVFPHWLYAAGTLQYLDGLIGYQGLEHVPRRIAALRGVTPLARPDGYWDYTPVFAALTGSEAAQRRMATAIRPEKSSNPGNSFPAMAMLRDMLDAIPASTRVVLMWPPTHISYLPVPGSAGADTLRQCRAAMGAVTAGRGNVAWVDWSGDTDFNREPRNFHDEPHYVRALATQLTDAVGATLARMAAGQNAR